MVAVERQATRSGSRCMGQERSLAAWPPENIAPPEAAVNLFGVRQGKCILQCPGTSRSQQRQWNHGCGLTCPARYAGDALHRLETVLETHQLGDMRDARAERSWFLPDSTSPSRQKPLKWLYRPIETHGVPKNAEGGYAECRSSTFAGVPPVPSRAGSRPPTFVVVRCWLSAFLSRLPVSVDGSIRWRRVGRKRCGSGFTSVPAVFSRMVVWVRLRHAGEL